MKVLTEDGTDITESVQLLYDFAVTSMEWGSGLLDNEEMERLINFAIMMGYEVPDLPTDSAISGLAGEFPEHYHPGEHVWDWHVGTVDTCTRWQCVDKRKASADA